MYINGLLIMAFVWLMGMTVGTTWIQFGKTLDGIIIIVIAWLFVIVPFVPNLILFYMNRKNKNISK